MHILISNTSPEPIYTQITRAIRDQIVRGELKALQPLPSIRALAATLQISVITTKRAYDELERNGFILTVPGKGSYVASQNQDFLREGQIKLIEERLQSAVDAARAIGMNAEELREMVTILYQEEGRS